jgi:predicted DNA-binding WGR domain protein
VNTTEQESRARRAAALRAKANATTFEAERDACNEKAAKLEKTNADEGYVDQVSAKQAADAMFDLFTAQARAEKLRRYQEHIARQQAGTLHDPNCLCNECLDLDPMKIFKVFDAQAPRVRRTRTNRTHAARCSCSTCFERRANATGGTYSSYTEYDPETGESRTHTPCTKCQPDAMCNDCFVKKYPTQPAQRSRSSHADCYANGVHDNSKAGRAACRRGRV